QIVAAAVLATLLREQFGPTPWDPDAWARCSIGLLAFSGVGLFMTELVRGRRAQAQNVRELQAETTRRHRAEEDARALIESSSAAGSHEIRNMAAAAEVLHSSVGKSRRIAGDQDFDALGSLIQALRKLSSTEVPTSAEQVLSGVDVNSLLRELSIVMNAGSGD